MKPLLLFLLALSLGWLVRRILRAAGPIVRSFDMLPTLPAHKLTNRANTDAIKRCQPTIANPASSVTLPNLSNIIRSKLGVVVTFAMTHAALARRVGYIVELSTEKQMGGVNARGVVAGMADNAVGRNRSVVKFIGHTVCSEVSSELAVAGPPSKACPRPAGKHAARSIYVGPKSVRNRAAAMMVRNKAQRLTFSATVSRIGVLGKRGLLAASALTKARGVRAGGARFWYTLHADLLSRVRPRSGVLAHRLGISMPNARSNYTINQPRYTLFEQ